MVDLHKLSKPARSAAMRGGTDTWGQHGDSRSHVRYADAVQPTSRRRCQCGCNTRATHRGMANGVCLTTACEMRIRRWVRDGR